jgi:hypothetical protein
MEDAPTPRMKGRFNLYDTADGGLHISYQEDDREEIQHIDVPGQVLAMAKMLESGSMNPLQALGKLKTVFGGRK